MTDDRAIVYAPSLFGSGGARMPGSGSPAGAGGYSFDLGDLFGGNAGGSGGRLGDLLGGVFGGGGGRTTQQTTRPRRGADIETEASLTFGDAIDGSTVSLRLAGEAACKACMGTGAKAGTVPRVCPTCEGTGAGSRNLGNFAFSEPCKTCKGRGLIVDDPCAECSGSGPTIQCVRSIRCMPWSISSPPPERRGSARHSRS